MTELFEQDRKTADRQSSKGNQLKWYNENTWYKADYTGYEGMAEYMVSHLLILSDLEKNDVCIYDTEKLNIKKYISWVPKREFFTTGLAVNYIGTSVSRLITIDAFFLNEDSHTHNIAVLIDSYNRYHDCPFFDHGAALLSDTSMDYPLE